MSGSPPARPGSSTSSTATSQRRQAKNDRTLAPARDSDDPRSGILSGHAHASARPGSRPEPTAAERTVAQLLPIEAEPATARRARDSVPLWFHTFCLNRAAEIYTPGVALDHSYSLAALPD